MHKNLSGSKIHHRKIEYFNLKYATIKYKFREYVTYSHPNHLILVCSVGAYEKHHKCINQFIIKNEDELLLLYFFAAMFFL